MKINDIKADGTVYWYDTGRDWGTWLTATYTHSPVIRVGEKRYTVTGSSWSRFVKTTHEDPKGRYAAFRKVNEDGSPLGDDPENVYYLQSAHIRDTMAEVRRRYDARHVADKAAEELRKVKADEAADEAAALRQRLTALGVEGFTVHATDGRGYGSGSPAVEIELTGDRVAALTALLDRIERLETVQRAVRDKLAKADAVAAVAYQAGFRDGEAANDAARDKALGYELRPEQVKALKAYEES